MLERRSTPPAPKELALQIVDIISLRREIRLAYVGLWDKCFEITEHSDSLNSRFQADYDHAISVADTDHIDGNSDGDDDTEDDENDDGNDSFVDGDSDFMEETSEDDGDSEAESFAEGAANRPQPRLRLREILYYDDKVDLFRARHGKL